MSYFEDRLAEIRSNPSLVRVVPPPRADVRNRGKREKPSLRQGTKEGLIYFITSGDQIKVGFTRDVNARVADLQTGNHKKLYVEEAFVSYREAEKMIHRRFKADHISGEWFQRSFEMEELMADLMDYRGMAASASSTDPDAPGYKLLERLEAVFIDLPDLKFILETIGKPWPKDFPRTVRRTLMEDEMSDGKVVSFQPRPGGEAGDTKPNERRWFVRIEYRSDNGGEFHQHFVEELDEIAAIVEAGPHWDTIVEISVFLNRKSENAPDLTIEKARLL